MTDLVSPGRHRLELTDGWELARSAAGQYGGTADLDGLGWRPARVPGTAAGAPAGTGAGTPAGTAAEPDFDQDDWWFRVAFDADAATADEEVLLVLGGLATVAEVYLNGECLLRSESMFAAHALDVGDRLRGRNELIICCRALAPRLQERRRPRARWRTRLVSASNLRFYRTMLLGRAPGFAPGPAVVGPWRPVALERRRGLVVRAPRLRARVLDGEGVLECQAQLRAPPGTDPPSSLAIVLDGPTGVHAGELAVERRGEGAAVAAGTLIIGDPALWWPHTHGTPALYAVRIGDPESGLPARRVGFRRLQTAADLVADGLDLRVNGVPVFARGAVWTPWDLRGPHTGEAVLRRALERVVECGMNMLRIPGIAAYESESFYDLCDELGILVWQDFMFANLDYPEQDQRFMETVETEVRTVLAALAGRPSLAALCGGSEVAQQVAMTGLDPALAEGPLYGRLLPALVAEADVEAPYIPSAPWGGDLPFRPDRGVANYYGVGAYLRPLEDARRSEVRFAAECLAFANVPDEPALEALHAPGGLAVHHPAWKAGVPRDAGAGWDFDDVRDHYLKLLFGVDPVALRSVDPNRYLELSRAVSGEVMAEVFGEWRRAGSPCRGALVLWLKDLVPGAGWGVLDHRGEPKVAYHHLRRALAPLAVWSTDEGLGGIAVHVANDGPSAVRPRLRVALYRDFGRLVQEAGEDLELGPHAHISRNVEAMLGRFVDASCAYRFGPPGHDLIALSLENVGDGEPELLSQAFRFPAGRPSTIAGPAELGLTASASLANGGRAVLKVASERFVYGVRVNVPGYVAADDAFGLEPGRPRVIELAGIGATAAPTGGELTALNLSGRIRIDFAV